jgi:hypothetical protein
MMRPRRSFHRYLSFVGSLMLAGGCGLSDPGWHYASPEGEAVHDDGLRYKLRQVNGIEVRVHGGLFAGSLRVELDVQNAGNERVEIDTGAFAVLDAKGSILRRRVPLTATCEGRAKGEVCVLGRGQTCQLAGTFQALPYASGLGGWFGMRNPDLREITVRLTPGPARKGAGEVDFQTRLQWTE